jgi:hypothetical protein
MAAAVIAVVRRRLKLSRLRVAATWNWVTATRDVTADFKAKTICSSYVCTGSSCHTYG